MQGHQLLEAAAAVVLVIGALVFVPASVIVYVRSAGHGAGAIRAVVSMPVDPDKLLDRAIAVIAAAMSFGAATIHFAAVQPHLEEFVPYAIAFGALGVGQLGLGFALLRGWPLAQAASVVLSIGVLGVWVLSRTVGLPWGPEPWVPEAIGSPDVISSVFEAAIAGLLVAGPLYRRPSRATLERVARSIHVALVPISGIVVVITLIAVAALLGEGGTARGMDM